MTIGARSTLIAIRRSNDMGAASWYSLVIRPNRSGAKFADLRVTCKRARRRSTIKAVSPRFGKLAEIHRSTAIDRAISVAHEGGADDRSSVATHRFRKKGNGS